MGKMLKIEKKEYIIIFQFHLKVLCVNNNFSFTIFWHKLLKRIFMCHMTCLKSFL